tara:strand:+ start:265 stop:435 length:171 start_codon:yes stop_codon:yes gene_type:complete
MTEEEEERKCVRMERAAFIISAFIYTFFLVNIALIIYENYQQEKGTQYTILPPVEE